MTDEQIRELIDSGVDRNEIEYNTSPFCRGMYICQKNRRIPPFAKIPLAVYCITAGGILFSFLLPLLYRFTKCNER